MSLAVPATARTTGVREMVAVHAGFLALAAVAIALDAPAKGWAVLACVVVYNAAVPLTAKATGRDDLFRLWAFLLPVSVFLLLPDWVLADLLGTIAFPDVGGPRADDVIPLAMCGMWVAPLFAALALAQGSPGKAAGLALVAFAGAEVLAPALELWEPTDAPTQVAGVALYVLPAEAALGWAAMVALPHATDAVRRIGLALAVSTFYLGALTLAYFLVDVAGWRVTA
jgi:hypothetical protein